LGGWKGQVARASEWRMKILARWWNFRLTEFATLGGRRRSLRTVKGFSIFPKPPTPSTRKTPRFHCLTENPFPQFPFAIVVSSRQLCAGLAYARELFECFLGSVSQTPPPPQNATPPIPERVKVQTPRKSWVSEEAWVCVYIFDRFENYYAKWII